MELLMQAAHVSTARTVEWARCSISFDFLFFFFLIWFPLSFSSQRAHLLLFTWIHTKCLPGKRMRTHRWIRHYNASSTYRDNALISLAKINFVFRASPRRLELRTSFSKFRPLTPPKLPLYYRTVLFCARTYGHFVRHARELSLNKYKCTGSPMCIQHRGHGDSDIRDVEISSRRAEDDLRALNEIIFNDARRTLKIWEFPNRLPDWHNARRLLTPPWRPALSRQNNIRRDSGSEDFATCLPIVLLTTFQ